MEQTHPASGLLEELDLLQRPKAPDQSKPSRRSMLCHWKWKLVRFVDGIRRRRPHCVICIQIHQIDGLPPMMDGQVLVVGWKTKGCKGEHTLPIHVCQGNASFDEIFLHYCSRDVESALKSFTIWASLVDAADCDLGTFRVDLTQLAPADDSNSLLGGKTLSFVLGGLASGGALRLSVYCRMMEEESHDLNNLIGMYHGAHIYYGVLATSSCLTNQIVFCEKCRAKSGEEQMLLLPSRSGLPQELASNLLRPENSLPPIRPWLHYDRELDRRLCPSLGRRLWLHNN